MSDDPEEVFVDGGNPFSQIEDVIEPAFPGPTYDGSAAFLRKPHKFTPAPKPVEHNFSVLPPLPNPPPFELNSIYLVTKNKGEFVESDEIFEVTVSELSPSGEYVKLTIDPHSMKSQAAWYKVSNVVILDKLN